MKRTPARRSSLFLLECVIAILFFILTATVCVCLFAKAYRISKDSENLNHAVQLTSSYVEEFRGGEAFPPESRIYYDDKWELCDESSAVHTLTITMDEKEDMTIGHFSMDDLFETSLELYTGGGR